MKKLTLSILASVISFSLWAEIAVTFADRFLNETVPGVVVVSGFGDILGISDADGKISVDESDFPLSVRSLGYEAATVKEKSDTVYLTPATYSLGEVIVTPVDRPITRVLTYVREYINASVYPDTMQCYNQYMYEYFITDGKVKGYNKSDASGRKRNVISYSRYLDEDGDNLYGPGEDPDAEIFSLAHLMAKIPTNVIHAPEAIRSGAKDFTVQGKYYPEYAWRKSNDLLIVDHDLLAGNKNHTLSPLAFKIIGMTTDITEMRYSHAFRHNDAGQYDIYDYLYGISTYHMSLKGKIFKKALGIKEAVEMDGYVEYYPVLIQHLNVDEYKALKKEKGRTIEFIYPDNVPPLLPAVERLVERVDQKKITQHQSVEQP
ncbi:MAG: hypothetical protein K2H98_02900 [Duncaniella sp.]|nr:hypothetical protein [Duncaniella sp.]